MRDFPVSAKRTHSRSRSVSVRTQGLTLFPNFIVVATARRNIKNHHHIWGWVTTIEKSAEPEEKSPMYKYSFFYKNLRLGILAPRVSSGHATRTLARSPTRLVMRHRSFSGFNEAATGSLGKPCA